MARQLAERYGVSRHFTDVGAMLEAVRPDVVHITTPPQSHFPFGVMSLESGAARIHGKTLYRHRAGGGKRHRTGAEQEPEDNGRPQ